MSVLFIKQRHPSCCQYANRCWLHSGEMLKSWKWVHLLKKRVFLWALMRQELCPLVSLREFDQSKDTWAKSVCNQEELLTILSLCRSEIMTGFCWLHSYSRSYQILKLPENEQNMSSLNTLHRTVLQTSAPAGDTSQKGYLIVVCHQGPWVPAFIWFIISAPNVKLLSTSFVAYMRRINNRGVRDAVKCSRFLKKQAYAWHLFSFLFFLP